MLKKSILYILLLLTMSLYSQSDSIITYISFIKNIIQYHPYVKTLNIQNIQKSKAYITKNRGMFDPKLFYNYDQKVFLTKNYYSIISGGLKVPIWIGADLKAQYDYNTGLYINSSDNLPPNGLWSIGFNTPILKNLFIDERRWGVKSARLDLKIAEQEFQYELLNFLSEATYKYWQWFEIYNKYLLLKNTVQVNKDRLIATISAANMGDLPSIDTVETSIQYNNFLIQLKLTETELQNIINEIQYYLQWDNNQFSFQDKLSIYPEIFQFNSSASLIIDSQSIDSIVSKHPAYQKYQIKIKNLHLEKKFRIEMIKPELNITYNALLISNHPNDPLYNPSGYKWGLNFHFPAYIRKERAELKLVQLKLQETQMQAETKRAELLIKANNYLNYYKTYANQLSAMNDLVKRYELMLNAEKEKFFAGESSVFLVNARENYLLDARMKQISFYSKLVTYKYLFELSLAQIPK